MARKRKFAPTVEADVRKRLEATLTAVEYALAELEVPTDEQEAITLQNDLEDVLSAARKAFDLFSDEMYEVFPNTDPRAGRR